MEFLVRLEDKINTQVFCHNPVHADRAVYDDPTFETVCPECGGSEWLYRKNNAVSKKGSFITYKPDNWTWGTNERKHFGIIRIDCTEEQAAEWCQTVEDEVAKSEIEQLDTDYKNRYAELFPPDGSVGDIPIPSEVETWDVGDMVLGKTEPTEQPESEKLLAKAIIEADPQMIAIKAAGVLATAKAQIAYRPRKNRYDFEAVLSTDDLKNWNDKRVYSKVITQETIKMEVI